LPSYEGVVEVLEPLGTAIDGTVAWYRLRIKDAPEEFALHRNWIVRHGDLKPGDRILYEASKARLPGDGNDGRGWILFERLRRIGEPETSGLEANPGL
jgi:hypothetical protein